MIIGIVSSASNRQRFYEMLLASHTLLYFTPDEILNGIPAYCDGFLLDAGLLNGEHRKLQKLLSRMPDIGVSAFMAGEESHPCIIHHNAGGGVQIQCGRLAAAKERGADPAGGCRAGRTHTLVFQDVSE